MARVPDTISLKGSRIRRGFALPAVLAVTGIVTIVFLVAMTALYSLTAEAASARARVRFLQRALTAEATLSYMMATEPVSTRGISPGAPRREGALEDVIDTTEGGSSLEIRFDGRPYLMTVGGPLVARLQDQAGMINLAYLTPGQAARLTERLGAPPGFERTLQARVLDYVDPDDLRELDGAEAADYPSGSGPANRYFRRVDEWLSVLGVREAVDLARWRALRDTLIVDHSSSRQNANTASATAMEVLFGTSPRQAEAAIRQREQTPFLDFASFAAALGGDPDSLDPEARYTFPSGRTVITLRDGLSSWVYRARITLTPTGQERPLWIDQTDMLEAPRRQAAETKNVPGFPYTPR